MCLGRFTVTADRQGRSAMRREEHDLARALLIARDYWDVPVRVRLRPYVHFIRQLDEDLEKLVAQWAHTAAPNALGWRRRF
jgi:hypothetical protein